MTLASRPPRSALSQAWPLCSLLAAHCPAPGAPASSLPQARGTGSGLGSQGPTGAGVSIHGLRMAPPPLRGAEKGPAPVLLVTPGNGGGGHEGEGGRVWLQDCLPGGARPCPSVHPNPPPPLSPRSPPPRAPHFSFVSSVLPRRQARGEAGAGGWGRQARVGASPAPLSPQDPDPRGPPAAPPGAVPAAAQAPCPVSASRAPRLARPLWPPSPGHSLPGERQPGLGPA